MPDIDLSPNTPTEMPALTSGAYYSVHSSLAGGKLLTEAETKAGVYEPLCELGKFNIPALPGTKLRFTLSGTTATATIRVTPAV